MNYRFFAQQLASDCRRGLAARWKWYLMALLIFALQWIIAHQNFVFFYEQGAISSAGTSTDYLLYCFQGASPRIPEKRFIVPTSWLCIFAGSLLSSLSYSGAEIDDYALHYLLRGGSKGTWWLSKCVWCLLSTVTYYAVGYCTILLLCVISGIPLSEEITPLLSGEYFQNAFTGNARMLVAFVMPLLTMICLNAIQLTLSLFISPALSFLCCLVVLLLSSYYMSYFFIGNYAMALRSSYCLNDGIKPGPGIVMLPGITLLITAVGMNTVKYKDLLRRNKEVR